jgi:hypothetical protein
MARLDADFGEELKAASAGSRCDVAAALPPE